jgi:hypothetical protein
MSSHAARRQFFCFGDDPFRRTADGRALDAWNGAKGTRAAAAIGNLDVGRCTLHSHTLGATLVRADGGCLAGQVIHRLGAKRGTTAHLFDELDNVHPASRANDAIQPRHLLHELLPPDLGQAPSGDEDLLALLGLGQLAQILHGFLTRWADKAAGVDDEH